MSDEIDETPQESTNRESTNQEPSMTEEIKAVEGEAQTEATTETQKTMPPLTAERVTDITLGLGKAAVEVLDKAARQLDDSVRQIRTDAPGFLTEMEEKGRPLREKLSEGLRGFSITDVFTRTGEKPAGEPDNTLDDIEALENRVRELEQQVSSDPLPKEPAPSSETREASPFSMLELDDDPVVVAAEQEAAAAPAPTKKPPVRKKKKEEESSAAE